MAGNSGSRGENVAEMFQALQALVGDWYIDQLVFPGPNMQPIKNTGRVTSRSLIGGLAVLVITEIPAAGSRIAQLMTYNPGTTRYELAIVDASLDQGLVLLTGEELNERSSPEIRARFGKAAMAVRQWDITDAGTVLGGFAGEGSTGEPRALRVIENQISADRWVVEFLLRGPQGEFVVLENVITRVQPGCQPQLGCELGCAGLPGCQQGCEGLQGQTGTQGLLGCQCPSQRTGTSMMGASQRLCQTQCLCQPQLLGEVPLALPAPLVCVAQPMNPAQTACTRLPVPPPLPERPGEPGR